MSISVFIIFDSEDEQRFQALMQRIFAECKMISITNGLAFSNRETIFSIYKHEWKKYLDLTEEEDYIKYVMNIERFFSDPLAYSMEGGLLSMIRTLEIICKEIMCFIDNDHGIILSADKFLNLVKQNPYWLQKSHW